MDTTSEPQAAINIQFCCKNPRILRPIEIAVPPEEGLRAALLKALPDMHRTARRAIVLLLEKEECRPLYAILEEKKRKIIVVVTRHSRGDPEVMERVRQDREQFAPDLQIPMEGWCPTS